MSDNNVCETCGGYKTIWYKVDLVMKGGPEQTVVPSQGVLTTTPFNLCPGHPEPAPKHDGQLDKEEDSRVYYNYKREIVVLAGGSSPSFLTPKEALSLLAWLLQEKEALERWIKEGERE